MTAEDQAFHMGQAWEALPEPKRQFNFYVIEPDGRDQGLLHRAACARRSAPTTCNWCTACG